MKSLKFLLLAVYLSTVFYIVFGIGNDWRFSDEYADKVQSINIVPFSDKISFFQHPEIWGGNNLYFTLKEIIGNLLILLPFPMILILGFGVRSVGKAVMFGFLLSFFIEATQFFTGMGHADIDDLVLNTVGAIAGALLAYYIKKLRWWPSNKQPLEVW